MPHRAILSALLLVAAPAHADAFVVEPFLQDVTPTTARLVWESDADDDAQVAWGQGAAASSPDLPSSRVATRRATGDGTWIHEVQLTGLSPSSRVTWRVTLGGGASVQADLQTAPAERGDRTFRLVAMSDMQRAAGAPGKWAEVVNDGVLAWARAQWGDDVAAQFAMVLLPGDLVDNGWDHAQWTDDFFAPLAPLSRHVPLYPALGNHEANADWYFDYFHLPETGDPALPDQWWSARHENVLVVGLDSNAFLLWADQLAWLDAELAVACDDPDLDFVLAQLHHPWQSEAWVPGESPLTGQLVQRLSDWSISCDKPSVHLFGHTHAYSRGQLRDAPHLMVNVATGGGAIDRWGEHLQTNHEAFSVSTDDWGFVVIDVASGDDPSLRVRRFSRGDADTGLANVLTDEIVVRRYAEPPTAPEPLAPHGELDGACVTLEAGDFADPDGGAHQATHWQLARGCGDADPFVLPAHELWRQDRDLYFDVDGQEGDDLTDEVLRGLEPGAWCWRVRYRDDGLAWSPWSEPVAFTVRTSSRSTNLLENPGGEQGEAGWLVDAGVLEATGAARCGAPAPWAGSRALALGGRCATAPESTARARVTLPPVRDGDVVHLALTAQGVVALDVSLVFLDALGAPLPDPAHLTAAASTTWTEHAWEVALPAEARHVDLVLHAEGTVDLDALDLSIGAPGPLDCAPSYAPTDTAPQPPSACGCAAGPGPSFGGAALALTLGLVRRRRARSEA